MKRLQRNLAAWIVFSSLLGILFAGVDPTSAAPYSLPDTTTAADSIVTFNEIMYHPAGANAPPQWVELYNAMSIDVDVSNWRIEGGIDFQFPTNTVLPANHYLVVASDPDKLRPTASSAAIFGPFAKRLSKSGETLILRNHNGRLMDQVTYASDAPWPLSAGGSGASLAKRQKYAASSPPENWRASLEIGGTPGHLNFVESTNTPPIVDTLIVPGSAATWMVPSNDALSNSWTQVDFDDSAWTAGTAAIGFDTDAASALPLADRAYSFEGSLIDVSAHGLNGVNNGAIFSASVPPAVAGSQSLQFDGVSSRVDIADGVNPTGYTIAIWVSVDAVRPCSLIVRTDVSGQDVDYSHQLRINTAGQFEHYLYDGNLRSVAATNVIIPGVWYHVAGTATNGGPMRIYVNGISSGGSVTIGNLWSGGDQWRLGTDSGQTAYYFKGRLDELGIWEEVLNPTDILLLASGAGPASGGGYGPIIRTDTKAAMFQKYSSLFLRVPFTVRPAAGYNALTLQAQYDDGFVAYLNGVEVARRNAPLTLGWSAAATVKRTKTDGLAAETIDLSAFTSLVQAGPNLLSFQALNSASNDGSFLLTAQLSGQESPPSTAGTNVAFSEVGVGPGPSFIELRNADSKAADLTGYHILSNSGGDVSLNGYSIGLSGFLALQTNDLGFDFLAGDKLFLIGPGETVIDAVQVEPRDRGRPSDTLFGDWLYPSAPTPGASNRFALCREIVINEIMYNYPADYSTNSPPVSSKDGLQWIELYNRAAAAVDLGGWQLSGLIAYTFPAGVSLAPDGYLVIANSASAMNLRYPGITVLGDWSGKLSHRGGRIVLLDAQGNPANEVTYYADSPWPAKAGGGGSSLELRDPRADNTAPESWAASDESFRSAWRHYSYQAAAIAPIYTPGTSFFREFRMGLLTGGEALIDNVSVLEAQPGGGFRQLLQNTGFTAGTAAWRLPGNHRHSRVEPSPDDPSNPVLHLIATGPMSYLSDRLETTLKANGAYVSVVPGRQYQISFDAKWISGSPQLHTELYYNKVAATTILEMPRNFGTPGRRNSAFVTNAGPTYSGLLHSPAVPDPADPVEIDVAARDPDGVASLRLHYSANAGSWQTLPMAPSPSDPSAFQAMIPPQASGAVVQFYIEGADRLGAVSTYPAGGVDSHALIKIQSPQAVSDKQTFRIIMTEADSIWLHDPLNMMSNDELGCTVVHNESEIYYNAHIRLHGSMFSRDDPSSTGFDVGFPADHLFRGSRASVVVRRSDLIEVIGKHILNQVGGLPGNYDDVIYLISHRSDNVGSATLNLANYDSTYVGSQFETNNAGTLFKLEGIRDYQATDNGSPEGNKLSQPIGWIQSYDITNLGADKEQYRWSILISNQRDRDDYSSVVAMGKAFAIKDPAALQAAAAAAIDIDEWARYFAIQTLVGAADIYAVENPHNICFYARSDDGRMEVLQNDWGYFDAQDINASIYGNKNVFNILKLPVYRRVFQGHLLDIINGNYNSAYLTRWAQHFTAVTGYDYSQVPGYADARSAAVRRQLAAKIPFTITSSGGTNSSVSMPSATLQGRAWIDVHDIGLAGAQTLLPVTWLDDQQWRIVLPVNQGTNYIHLVAYDFRGRMVGQASTVVVGSFVEASPRDALRISELMYDPAPPSAAELAAGFSNNEDFEFIELVNTASTGMSLLGVKVTAGVAFDFSAGSITNLGSGARVLIVANQAAFNLRYGTNLPVAGAYTGHLSNDGELVQLTDTYGNIVQEFTYQTVANWPSAAGNGRSIEVVDPLGDDNDPTNWRASAAIGGTPGSAPISGQLFLAASYQPDGIHLQFNVDAGQNYTVYRRDSLVEGDWIVVAAIPPNATPRLQEVIDAVPSSGSPQRFYRLSAP